MTGEISLTGKVLPVGGIKEKALAARRSGAKAILLPLGNKKDFEELPLYVREHLEVHYASEYSDVFKLAFPKTEEEKKE
jgi:Lon-like ATP-dependent protease